MICIVLNPKRLNETQRKYAEELWPYAMSLVKIFRAGNRDMKQIDLPGIAHVALMEVVARHKEKPPVAYVRTAIWNAAVEEVRRMRRSPESGAVSLSDPRALDALAVYDEPYDGEPAEYMRGEFKREEKAILRMWSMFPVHQSIRSIASEIGVNYQKLTRLVNRLQQPKD